MIIDTKLLREQINFLDNYPWRDNEFPLEVEGIIILLEVILDKEEGHAR